MASHFCVYAFARLVFLFLFFFLVCVCDFKDLF